MKKKVEILFSPSHKTVKGCAHIGVNSLPFHSIEQM